MKVNLKKSRVIVFTVSLIALSLLLWFVFNYKYYSGSPLFIAGREHAICYTELTLKDNNTFREDITCMFNHTTRGNYRFINDTIYFDAYSNDKHTYKFALIERNKYGPVLNLYNENGTIESQFYIDLNKLEE